jgi:hypothetical protein
MLELLKIMAFSEWGDGRCVTCFCRHHEFHRVPAGGSRPVGVFSLAAGLHAGPSSSPRAALRTGAQRALGKQALEAVPHHSWEMGQCRVRQPAAGLSYRGEFRQIIQVQPALISFEAELQYFLDARFRHIAGDTQIRLMGFHQQPL